MTSKLLAVLAVTVAMLCLCDDASAQRRRYPVNNRPVISPWLNMFNRNPGILDNYNTYVRPEMQLRNTLQNQRSAIELQATEIQGLSQQQRMMQTRPSQVRPTGTGAGFMNYSHFYPTNRSQRR